MGVTSERGQEPLSTEAEDIVGTCYQAMTGEGTNNYVSAVVRTVHKLVKLL